ncbi:MAG: Dabb family protein [Bacteroidota bacterium]
MMNTLKGALLRHLVLFKFKAETTSEAVITLEQAFADLPSKIPEIVAFEWGLNNSPEGLNEGFTHCFLVSFSNEADRDNYLPHPEHKKFVELAGPYIEKALVVDYWTP